MNTKKIIYFALTVILLIVVFVMWKQVVRKELILANPPIEKPLTLMLEGGADSITLEQQQNIDDYKAKVLERVRLGATLTEKEKKNFVLLMDDRGLTLPYGETLVNQSVLGFSADELDLISQAIKR